jgi:peptide-methionine (S)-S-oxide reductase
MLWSMSSNQPKTETALFGAGCFWGVEEAFRTTLGVIGTAVGYAGGKEDHPTYEQVCSDLTGHAEVVEVKFDPKIISYDKLLNIFFTSHNPTTRNRQGPDIGSQYRSVIFFTTPAQEKEAHAKIAILEKSDRWSSPIVTHVEAAPTFWPAEEYHQKYLLKQGKTSCHI